MFPLVVLYWCFFISLASKFWSHYWVQLFRLLLTSDLITPLNVRLHKPLTIWNSTWISLWDLKFNISKTEILIFILKSASPHSFQHLINWKLQYSSYSDWIFGIILNLFFWHPTSNSSANMSIPFFNKRVGFAAKRTLIWISLDTYASFSFPPVFQFYFQNICRLLLLLPSLPLLLGSKSLLHHSHGLL